MVAGALITGTFSTAAYVGASIATGSPITASGLFGSYATGAFIGALCAPAGAAESSEATEAIVYLNDSY